MKASDMRPGAVFLYDGPDWDDVTMFTYKYITNIKKFNYEYPVYTSNDYDLCQGITSCYMVIDSVMTRAGVCCIDVVHYMPYYLGKDPKLAQLKGPQQGFTILIRGDKEVSVVHSLWTVKNWHRYKTRLLELQRNS